VKAVAFLIVSLLLGGILQTTSIASEVDPRGQEPLKVDALTGFIHLLSKPQLAYPEEALQQHIEGKVELELSVSPQGDVVSERAVWGPPALQQVTLDAFRKVKYIPFLRDGEPSAALVKVIVAYEKGQAMISTESEHAIPEFQSRANKYRKYTSTASAGEAIQGPVAGPGTGAQPNPGDFGLGTGELGRQMGNLTILSDTQGVDFGPYFQLVVRKVRDNWYNAIPLSAQHGHGTLAIEFAITKDGKVGGMKLVGSSGDVSLDRAAWAGISASDPFPALPSEFKGQYVALRFHFYYNPTKEELAPSKPSTSAPAVK
jgi:TonB family protein